MMTKKPALKFKIIIYYTFQIAMATKVNPLLRRVFEEGTQGDMQTASLTPIFRETTTKMNTSQFQTKRFYNKPSLLQEKKNFPSQFYNKKTEKILSMRI